MKTLFSNATSTALALTEWKADLVTHTIQLTKADQSVIWPNPIFFHPERFNNTNVNSTK